jgi:hypothetical protein
MKPVKYIFSIALLIAIATSFCSCYRSNYYCNCNTGDTTRQSYNLGSISYSDATSKCNALKQQYGWEMCGTADPK